MRVEIDGKEVLEAVSCPIPDHLIASIKRYVSGRIPTGGFLQAILENDLKEAVRAADEDNQWRIAAIVAFCYNHIPSACWGSPAKVSAWLARPVAESVPPELLPTFLPGGTDPGEV